MSPTEWATAARETRYQQKLEDQQAIDILESMLLGERAPSDAATAIAAIYEAPVKASNHGAVAVFWAIVSNAARVCGGTEEQPGRLADLIIAIQSLPTVTNVAGSPVKNDGAVYWKDLPGWGIGFREYDVDGPGDFLGDWPWHEQVAPLLNATTFAATLLARAPFSTGMEFHATTTISSALGASNGDLEEHQQAELYLPAAATWILVGGSKLREACMTRYETSHALTLTPERWDEWKGRFEAIGADVEFEHAGREWATRAASHMGAIGGQQ